MTNFLAAARSAIPGSARVVPAFLVAALLAACVQSRSVPTPRADALPIPAASTPTAPPTVPTDRSAPARPDVAGRDCAPSGPAPRARTETADLSAPVRLDMLIPLLLTRNPTIRAAHARVAAATARYPQAISLPDPMVEATYFARNAMAPDRDFPRYTLMFRQEVPFPTTLALRGCGAAKEAEAEAIRYEAVVRDGVTRLKEVHAERAYLAEAVRVEEALRDVYRRYAEIARGGTESGRTRLPESFRAEALRAQADYDLEVLREQLAVEDERLRALLDLPPGHGVGLPADAGVVVPTLADTDALVALAEVHSQELRAAHVDTQVAEVGSRRARNEAVAPTLFLGGGWMKNDEFDMATGATEDSAVVTFGFTIPLGNPGRRAAICEADAIASAARASEAAERLRLRADVARAAFQLRNAHRLAGLYEASLLPQAEAALLRSQEMVKEGKETLASSLELAATWQGLRIARARVVADHAQAIARLERLLGTSAVPVAEDGR
jgi:cobalt-zinc-cadmium efflux system outer membrane protein